MATRGNQVGNPLVYHMYRVCDIIIILLHGGQNELVGYAAPSTRVNTAMSTCQQRWAASYSSQRNRADIWVSIHVDNDFIKCCFSLIILIVICNDKCIKIQMFWYNVFSTVWHEVGRDMTCRPVVIGGTATPVPYLVVTGSLQHIGRSDTRRWNLRVSDLQMNSRDLPLRSKGHQDNTVFTLLYNQWGGPPHNFCWPPRWILSKLPPRCYLYPTDG